MTLSVVQATGNSSGSFGLTSYALAYGSSVTSGNLLAVWGIWLGTTTSGSALSITDSQGNSWTPIHSYTYPMGGGVFVTAAAWYGFAGTSGADTLTLHSTVSGALGLALAEVSGVTPSTLVVNYNSSNGSSTAPSSGTVTCASGSLLFGIAGASSVTITAGSGFTDAANLSSHTPPFDFEYQPVNSNTAATWTLGASTNWAALGVSFSAGTSNVLTIAPPPASLNMGGIATLSQQNSVAVIAATLSMDGVGVLDYTGTFNYAPTAASMPLFGSPPSVPTPIPFPLRFARGPYSFLANVILPEGAPFEAGIVSGATTFEMLLLGGHDGVNKLVGGGFQTTSGMPSFTAPAGACAFDPSTQLLWISTGSGWISK